MDLQWRYESYQDAVIEDDAPLAIHNVFVDDGLEQFGDPLTFETGLLPQNLDKNSPSWLPCTPALRRLFRIAFSVVLVVFTSVVFGVFRGLEINSVDCDAEQMNA